MLLKLYNYIVLSLKLRENSKFIFTRALSDYLQIIEEEARKRDISLEKISNLDVKDVLKNFYDSNKKINYNMFKNKRYLNSICKLPYLITNRSDFFVASILISKPNFITDNKVVSKIFHLKKGQNTNQIKDKIVLIENADPGFDWIFNFKIKGLITKYGGVNSHMSIRCHELNIPAAIGVGEESFDKLISGDKMILNCKEKKIFRLMSIIISSNYKKHYKTYIDFVDHYWINYFKLKKNIFSVPNIKSFKISSLKNEIKLIILPGGNNLFSKDKISKQDSK